MIQNHIKFSHRYWKFPNTRPAKLVGLYTCDYSELSCFLEEYDTKYYVNGFPQYYQLPDTKLIVLLLLSDNDILFTTIRSWNVDKEKYYRNMIGKEVELVIEEKEEK
jgi:hypothetical protein